MSGTNIRTGVEIPLANGRFGKISLGEFAEFVVPRDPMKVVCTVTLVSASTAFVPPPPGLWLSPC